MRRVALLLGLAFAACGLRAANAIKVVATADRLSCRYACGETAEVSFEVFGTNGVRLSEGELTVSVDNFGAQRVLAPRQVDLSRENPFKVNATARQPGFLRFTVSGRGLDGPFVYGVGFDVPKIRPGTPEPEDFDAFWSAAIARYDRAYPDGPAVCLDEKLSRGEWNVWRLTFDAPGRKVYGFIAKEKALKPGRHPARVEIAAAGYGNWSQCPTLVKGHVSLKMTVYPFEPDTDLRLQAKYDELNADARRKWGVGLYAQGGIAESREAYFFYPVILACNRAVAYLAARDDVDASDITYCGASQGGGLGLAVMALSRRFRRGAVMVPALTDLLGDRACARQSGWPRLVEAQPESGRQAAERYAPYFCGVNFARRIRVPVLFLAGFADCTCAPHAVCAAYNVCPAEGKRLIDCIGMPHRVEEKYYGIVSDWLSRSPTRILRDRLREVGLGDGFAYAWSTSYTAWSPEKFDVFRQRTGVEPIFYFAEFRDIGGTSRAPEWYAWHREEFASLVKREYVRRRAVPFVTWHLHNPYVPARWNEYDVGMRYRHSCAGYPQEHRYVLREIVEGTGALCGTGRVDGVNAKAFPNPRAWLEWVLKDVAAWWRTVRDEQGRPIPIAFRFLHECDGDWFWWGRDSATPADYIAAYRFIVDVMRRELGAENVLFCYSPDKTWKSAGKEGGTGYLARYPGDDCIDIIGYDDYGIGQREVKATTLAARERMRIVSDIGLARNKICALFETGAKGAVDGFYTILHGLMTNREIHFALAATYDGACTFPASEAGRDDMRRFFRRPEVMSGDGRTFFRE